jgi:ubiquinol oxidase
MTVHFSQSWNEHHHLLIMEEMGGNERWADRFVAQHIAVFYYWTVIALYLYNPTWAYNLNQAVEEEAFSTYSNFVDNNGSFLQTQPAPLAAKKYYTGNDLYLFDTMHYFDTAAESSGEQQQARRPKMDTLYDAFVAVRDDELEHVKTMAYLQDDACR